MYTLEFLCCLEAADQAQEGKEAQHGDDDIVLVETGETIDP